MAISTIRFTINAANYDLPSASGFDVNYSYTSVPIKMANARTVWQVWPVQGDEDPSWIYHFTVSWKALTMSERTVLVNAFGLMRAGNAATMRDPEGASHDVKIDPDSPDMDLQGFAVAQTMYYRASIRLVSDEA